MVINCYQPGQAHQIHADPKSERASVRIWWSLWLATAIAEVHDLAGTIGSGD